jgi:tetratricopeptide (TPR) repeat protein
VNEMVQWLIRNKNGEIEGPLTTVEVVRRIRSGVYYGEEFVSRYPEGRWQPISYDENFFNILLEALEQELFEKPVEAKKERTEVTTRIKTLKKEFEQAQQQDAIDDDKTRVKEKPKGQAVFEDVDAHTPVIIEMEKESTKVGRAVADQKEEVRTRPKKIRQSPRRRGVSRRQQRSRFQLILFAGVVLVIAAVYLFLQLPSGGAKKIHLLDPKFSNSGAMDRRALQLGMKRAIESFRRDTFNDYLVAQDALVEIVQKSRSLDAFGFLCMTYRELWPFSHQDAHDHRVLERVLRRVQKINPKSPSANICLVVSHWVKGEYDDALRIMDSQLAEKPGLIFFNHMTGDIYAARQDYRSAAYYFSKVRELWSPPPVWSKSILQEARMYRKRGVHSTALKLYRKLLKSNPQHAVARIELGILEFNPFQNIQKAKDYISGGLASQQFIPKMIESEAFLTLAKISILQGDNQQGLRYAQKAFSIDSSNDETRELIVTMGGIKALNSIAIDNVNMVYLGEQYMKMRNYTAAQAEFRAAFEANRKNGFAALRAGEALWQLGQSSEAIQWVKRSIDADPKFIRSYLILADFQSQRYDYINAIETLKAALIINPRHHGIFRGFALIELRRRNYSGAVRFSQKALELYDTDIESLVILAKALNEQGDPEEAFKYLQRALELDSSNDEVQITFAQILAALQGTDSGIDHLDSLISKYGKLVYMRAIGELLTREERDAEAIQYYYDALEKNPNDKEILMALAKLYQQEKNYEEARDLFLDAAVLDPTDAEPIFLIGQLYLDSGKYRDALKQFEKVLKVNPNYPFAHYFAGRAHLKLRNYDRALEMARQERLMNPDVPEPYLLAGETYFEKKQYPLCTEEYQKVLTKGLSTADIFIKLARCYRLSGAYDSAMTMLTEAKDRESGNADIYKELGALYHEKGSYIKAVEGYRRYLQLRPNAEDKNKIESLIRSADKMGGPNG